MFRYVSLYNVTQLPSVFLVDRNNTLKARGESIENIEQIIKDLL